MNKADLIEALASRLGGRTQAATAVEAFVDLVLREVAAGGTVGVTGFGVFERVDRAARTGRNPRTGEAVPIAATSSPRFRPASYFKEVVADPSGLPDEGLAGVRVGSHEEGERAGAPASVRRRSGDAGAAPAGTRSGTSRTGAEAAPVTSGKGSDSEDADRQGAGREGADREGAHLEGADADVEHTTGRRSGAADSGKPATVRKVTPEEPQDAAQDEETADTAAGGGRLMIGGEDITRNMIKAKKAQLARVKNDQLAGPKKGKARKKADAKKAPTKKADSKKGSKRSGKKGKNGKKGK